MVDELRAAEDFLFSSYMRARPWLGMTSTLPARRVWASRKSGANRVASALNVALTDSAQRKIAERPTTNLAAYDAFLRGDALSGNLSINDAATAENVLHLIKPDVYVKGSDYAQDEKDLTGKICEEREASWTREAPLGVIAGTLPSSGSVTDTSGVAQCRTPLSARVA